MAKDEKGMRNCRILTASFLGFALIVFIIYLILQKKTDTSILSIQTYIIIVLYLSGLVFLFLLLILREGFLIEVRECISGSGFRIASALGFLFFVLLGSLFFSQPPLIIADPAQFEISIPIGENRMNMTAIENMGNSEINVSFDNSDAKIKFDPSTYNMKPGEKKTLIYNISVDTNASPGIYRNAINFTSVQKSIKIIPVIITVLPGAQYQVAINNPPVLNTSEWAMIRVTITNTGESPVHGINIRINESELSSSIFDFSEAGQNHSSNLLEKNEQFVTDWWIGARNNTDPSWFPVHFNVTSKNAGDQIAAAMIEIKKNSHQ